MRVNLRPNLESLGAADVWQVASQSEPGKVHYVVNLANEAPDGKPRLRCSCTGFQMQGKCWHTTKIKENNVHEA